MPVHYSGILVLTEPEAIEGCVGELESLPGIEVHYRDPDRGRIIAVQETETAGDQEAGLSRIQSLATVRMAALVEHRIDCTDTDAES